MPLIGMRFPFEMFAKVPLIIALPVMQLFLFGYAINTDPKHLPTGLLSPDHSRYERTIVAALRNTGYYDIRLLASEDAA
jgi:ABC-2 type transport system permease protein